MFRGYEGICVTFDHLGNFFHFDYIEDGLKHICSIQFYRNGKIQRLTEYLHDKRHGRRLTYNYDGQLVRESNFVHGKRVGQTRRYDDENRIRWIAWHDWRVQRDALREVEISETGKITKHLMFRQGERIDIRGDVDHYDLTAEDIIFLKLKYSCHVM